MKGAAIGGTLGSMKRRFPVLAGLTAPLILLVPAARADELLRFKSGYEMMVVSHREERGMIIVTLDGGGEVGFPKDALELVETGKPTQRVGPTPHANRIPPRARATDILRVHRQDLPSRLLLNSSHGESIRVGYSMNREGQMRFGSGPTGEFNGAKIGTDFRLRSKAPGIAMDVPPGGPQEPKKPRGPKEFLPTTAADIDDN